MKFSVFLTEQILAILFFALTAAVCVQLFVGSSNMSDDSGDLNYALMVAQNGAEAFKASHGDMEQTANILDDDNSYNADSDSGSIVISYDKNWLVCDSDDAKYQMLIKEESSPADDLFTATITVQTSTPKDASSAIFKLPVVAREVQ